MTTKFLRVFGPILTIFALLATAGIARAQFNASLSGTVLDPTQAAIPGATITLMNNATQAKQTVTSGAAGSFHFSELPPGSYTVTTKANGFKANVIDNVLIAAETPRNLNIALSTGANSENVTVDADSQPTLQTGDASIGTTIDSEEVQRLPLYGSDPYELLRTAPGITGNGARSGGGTAIFLPNSVGPGGSNASIFQTENQPQISADGQRIADNNYMIDGVSVNSLSHGGAAVVTPNEEAVGQMTIVSTSYDASLGRNTGAQIQVVSKSGTNDLHGSAFFLYDDPGLNSFNKFGGPGNAPTVRNQNAQRTWAASLGGPLIHNKLFGFVSYQGYKQKNPTYTNLFVETSSYRSAITAQRTGGVSARIVAANSAPRISAILTPPANSCKGFRSFAVPTGQTFSDNQGNTYAAGAQAPACQVVSGGLDIGSLTPGGASQLGMFPSGSSIATAPYYGASPFLVGGGFDGSADLQYVQVVLPQQSRGSQYNAHLDYTLTPKDLISASVYFTKLDNLGTSGTEGSRPQADVPFKPFNSAGTLVFVHTFSPKLVNELRGNFTRFSDNELTDSGNTVNYGIPYVNVQDYPGSCCQFGVTQSTTTPAVFAENTYEVRDTATRVFGTHTLRMGVELRFEQDNDNLFGYERPVYAFDGLWAFANDTSVYESVTVNPATGLPANTQRYYRTGDFAAFAQHDWKVTPNLTFNAGLRWEIFTSPYNKGFDGYLPQLGPTGSELSGASLTTRHNLWNLDHNNWGPKLGLAWQVQPKTVVRAGYALAYNNLSAATYNTTVEDGPGVANFGLCCGGSGSTAGIVYALGSSSSPSSYPINPATKVGVTASGLPNSGNTIEVYGVAKTIKYPSTDEYSLEVEHDLGWGTNATFGYQGASGRHFARLVNQNFLYNQNNTPFYAAYFLQTDSVMNYNALNIYLRHPIRKGVAFSAAYTFGKTLDQVSNGDGADGLANQTNPANNRSEYGPSDYDVRNHVVGTFLYETPRFHAAGKLVNALVGGFQINGTYTFNTGFPYTPVVSNYNTVPIVAGAATQNIVRPLAYYGGAGNSCSTSAFTGTLAGNFPKGGAAYFATSLPTGTTYSPGIGRNSFRSACYQDLDMSFAKQFAYEYGQHHTLLRFQANIFNILNLNEAAPIVANNGQNNVTNGQFGLSPNGDSGRVIELQARFQF